MATLRDLRWAVRPTQRRPAQDPRRSRHHRDSKEAALARKVAISGYRVRWQARAWFRAAAAGRGRCACAAGRAGAWRPDQPLPRRLRRRRPVPGQSRLRGVPVEFPRFHHHGRRYTFARRTATTAMAGSSATSSRAALMLAQGIATRDRVGTSAICSAAIRRCSADLPAGAVHIGVAGRRPRTWLGDALAGRTRGPGRPAGSFAAADLRAVAGRDRSCHPRAPDAQSPQANVAKMRRPLLVMAVAPIAPRAAVGGRLRRTPARSAGRSPCWSNLGGTPPVAACSRGRPILFAMDTMLQRHLGGPPPELPARACANICGRTRIAARIRGVRRRSSHQSRQASLRRSSRPLALDEVLVVPLDVARLAQPAPQGPRRPPARPPAHSALRRP